MMRSTSPTVLVEGVDAEAPEAGDGVAEVDVAVALEVLLLRLGHDREGDLGGVLAAQPLDLGHRHEGSVDPEPRVGAGLEVDVGGLAVERHFEQSIDMHGQSCNRNSL
jgi:hypothetical protein